MSAAPILPVAPGDAYLRTEFLERVAHELRGPVGVTAGALDEIELAMGADAEKHQAYFHMARRGVRRVLRMADRLQRTAELEAGNVEWTKAPLDLRALAADATQETELLEARRAVRVTVSSGAEACSIAADPDWMRAAIAEVVGNAIRFARTAASVRTEASDGEARVIVTDDGPGFSCPPARRFEPSATKRGVCLSLPLVRDVVAAHGGRLVIDDALSTKGDGVASGARVTLAFPLLKRSVP